MTIDTANLFSNIIRSSGLRMTRQRALILDILQSSQEHLDAEALHNLARQSDPQIGLATVYRTLALLKEFGMVNEYNLGEEHRHFETTPEVPHHHFTCLGCKKVIEFELPNIEDSLYPLLVKEEIEITRVNLSLEGYCQACRSTREIE